MSKNRKFALIVFALAVILGLIVRFYPLKDNQIRCTDFWCGTIWGHAVTVDTDTDYLYYMNHSSYENGMQLQTNEHIATCDRCGKQFTYIKTFEINTR